MYNSAVHIILLTVINVAPQLAVHGSLFVQQTELHVLANKSMFLCVFCYACVSTEILLLAGLH